jgi:glycosyltransferase involved in cell wall biosynthesis
MIEHNITGYVAKAFEPKDLAKGIQWCLENEKVGKNARERALKLYDQKTVAQQHLAYYAQA